MTTKTNLAFIATIMLCATAYGQNELSDTTKQNNTIEQDDPVIPFSPLGCCTACVASNTTGQPKRRISTSEVMSTTKRP